MAWGNNGSGNNNQNMDEILQSASALEQRITKIAESISTLSKSAADAVNSIGGAIRESGQLTGQAQISANDNLQVVKLGVEELANYLDKAKQHVRDINDVSKSNDVAQNFQQLNQVFADVTSALGFTSSGIKDLWDTLKNGGSDATRAAATDIDNFSNAFKDIINGIKQSIDTLPASVQSNFSQVQNTLVEHLGTVSEVATEAAKNIAEVFNAANQKQDSSQYFASLTDSISKLSEISGVGTTNIMKLLEQIGAGAGAGKNLADSFSQAEQAFKAFEHNKFSDVTDANAIQEQIQLISKLNNFHQELGQTLDNNLNKMDVEKALQIGQVMRNVGDQMKAMYDVMNSLDASQKAVFGPNFDPGTAGKQAQHNSYQQSVAAAVSANYNSDSVFQKHFANQINTSNRNATIVDHNAASLEEKANILLANQVAGGANYGFNVGEIVDSSKRLQGLSSKQSSIQGQIDGALKSGDKELLEKLYPQMATLQGDINNEALGLSKFLPTKQDMKNLPDDVQSVVTQIQKVIKGAQAGNANMISIGVSINPTAYQNTMQQLTNFNNQLQQTQQLANNTGTSVANSIASFSSNMSKYIGNPLTKGLGLMGLGSIASGAGLISGVMGAHQSQGQLETNMALAEIAGYGGYNDRARNDRFNQLLEMGLGDQGSTNGLIKSSDYAQSYTGLSREIQGNAYGQNDATAMQQFAQTSVLLQKGYGASESTINQGINTFYKELKMNASEVNLELLKMGQTAEAVNIPFDKYLQQVTGLATQLKNVGLDGKNASNIIATLMQGGMSSETAQYYASNVANSVTNVSPGMMAFAGVNSGQYGNFYDAVAGGQMLWNSDGTVNTKNANALGKSYGWYGDMMSSAFGGEGHDMIMMQVLQGQLGMDRRSASMSVNMMNEGKSLGDIVSMFESKEGAFADPNTTQITESQDALRKSIEDASKNLSGIDKSLNAYATQIQNLAHTQENTLRSATDLSKIINNLGSGLDKVAGALLNNTTALYALLAVMAIGPGNIAKGAGALFNGAKGLFGKTGGRITPSTGSKVLGGLSKVGKVGGWVGLGATALTLGYGMFGGGGSKSSTPSSDWMNGGYDVNPYFNNMVGVNGASSAGYDPYADVSQYSISANDLGGQGGRFAKNATTIGLGALSLASGPIGWAALAGGIGTGIFGDSIFGTSESSIMKKYGKGLDSSAYEDYIYNATSGQQVDKNFAMVATKGMDLGKGYLADKTTDQQMQFGTAYAKAIAAGEDSNSALLIAQRALSGSEKMQSLGREQVNAAMSQLQEAQASGQDINKMLTDEMPKNARQEKEALDKIASVTGTKMEELKKAIEEQGLTARQVIGMMNQNGSMEDVNKKADEKTKQDAIDQKIQDMIKNDLGLYSKKQQELATQSYIKNKDFFDATNMSDDKIGVYLKAAANGGSNDDALREIAKLDIGKNAFSSTAGDKPILSAMLKDYKQGDHWTKQRGNGHFLMTGDDGDNVIESFGKSLGISKEAVLNQIKQLGLNKDEVATMLYDSRQDEIDNMSGLTAKQKNKLQIKETSSGSYDFTELASKWGDYSDVVDKRLEELKKEQQNANQILNKIANNTSTSSLAVASDAAYAGYQVGLTGTVNGTVGTGVGGPANTKDVRGASGLTADQLNKQLGGALAGHGADFLAAEQSSGVSAAVLAAIAMHETGNGTSKAVNDSRHNVGGMMKATGGMKSFDSVADSIAYFGDYIKRKYVDDGLTSVEAIQKRYAPVGAGNDPTNLNSNWIGGVSKYWSALTGVSAPVTPTAATAAATETSSTPDYSYVSSGAYAPIDAGFGVNNPYVGTGAVNSKTKYASNLYGQGYTTLGQGMWNTQSFSMAEGAATKKIEHAINIDVKADKLFSDPAVTKDLTAAIEKVYEKHGAKLKKEVADELKKVIAARYN